MTPPGGNSTLCWSCHEPDRPALHYVDDPAQDSVIAPDSELRWDCKACHDGLSRGDGVLYPGGSAARATRSRDAT
ncbi:MAG: hypothetical protein R3F59_20350 [Myxococcota bacterium]